MTASPPDKMGASNVYPPESVATRLRIEDNTLDNRPFKVRFPRRRKGQPLPQPLHSLGQIDTLPLELLCQVLLELDVPTLTAFRRVNRQALTVVDSIPQYRRVFQHCSHLLQAIVVSGANSFNFNKLYTCLSTSHCTNCAEFGGYLYLINCQRICFFCLDRNKVYLPVEESSAIGIGFKKDLLEQLPHIVSLSGRYNYFNRRSRRRVKLYDRTALRLLAGEGMKTSVRWNPDWRMRQAMLYMAIVPVPQLTLDGGVDWGLHCLACTKRDDGIWLLSRFTFTRTGMLDHFEDYGPVKETGGRWQHVKVLQLTNATT